MAQKKRGFGAMSSQKRQAAARKGGKAAHSGGAGGGRSGGMQGKRSSHTSGTRSTQSTGRQNEGRRLDSDMQAREQEAERGLPTNE